jgi:hypothetical protein
MFCKRLMEPRNTTNDKNQQGKHEHQLPHEISRKEKERAIRAHDEAEKDMNEDAELTAHSPNDDLDEGETARLGEDTGGII